MADPLRRSDGRLRAGWRLGLFILILAVAAGSSAVLLHLTHFPKRKPHIEGTRFNSSTKSAVAGSELWHPAYSSGWPIWLSGGTYGFEGSAVTGILEAALLGTMIALAPRPPQVAKARPYLAGRYQESIRR